MILLFVVVFFQLWFSSAFVGVRFLLFYFLASPSLPSSTRQIHELGTFAELDVGQANAPARMTVRIVQGRKRDSFHVHIRQILAQKRLQRLGQQRHGCRAKDGAHFDEGKCLR